MNCINKKGNKCSQELHKLIIEKLKQKKVQSPFIDKIWGAALADMLLISKFNKEILKFCYMLLIFIANMHELFLFKINCNYCFSKNFKRT